MRTWMLLIFWICLGACNGEPQQDAGPDAPDLTDPQDRWKTTGTFRRTALTVIPEATPTPRTCRPIPTSSRT